MSDIRQAFITEDGKYFETKKEAQDYLRRPKIEAELNKLTGKNEELTSWLLDNREAVEMAFEVGQIRRVSKSERKKLENALKHIAESMKNDNKVAFLIEHSDTVLKSFRWPTVQRMSDEEKLIATKNTLLKASENNTELADWVIANKNAVLEAYNAGVVKPPVNQKAQEALAAWRAQKAAEKAAKEAAAG